MNISLIVSFLCGGGLSLSLAWIAHNRSVQSLSSERWTLLSARALLTGQLRTAHNQLEFERRRHALAATTAPVAPRRYVLPDAPTAGAPGKPKIMTAEELDAWLVLQEEVACRRTRKDFDRAVCFDPGCTRCFPAPQDVPTGAMTLPTDVA